MSTPTVLLICGSRDATTAMIEIAARAVLRAKELGWRVVVGDAEGIDAAVAVNCCLLDVPFSVYGITPGPRHFCCLKHRRSAYQRTDGDYLSRDRLMVSASDRVFAIWNGTSHGTLYTYNYAKKQGKPADIWQSR